MEPTINIKVSNRAKLMKLSVYLDGRIVLTVPKKHSRKKIEEFVGRSKPWLLRALKRTESERIGATAVVGGGKSHFDKHKGSALSLISEKVSQWNAVLGFEYSAVSVRNQKTRWGSCSHNKNLTFNYRVLFLPEDLVDYVVVHELVHLKHFNHSRTFWNLVESIFPDYADRKKRLKTYRFA